MEKTSVIINGLVVFLTRIADLTCKGVVYELSCNKIKSAWGYGARDSECVEILNGDRSLYDLAKRYINWAEREDKIKI